jgi:hypothetical protein
MKKLKKLIVSALLLFAVLGFLLTIMEMPVTSASAEWGPDYCVGPPIYYCWINYPYWQCRDQIGGVHCADPVN